jgi:hypothetical protein
VGFSVVAAKRWHNIKGSHFTDTIRLSKIPNRIVSAETYQGKRNVVHYAIEYEYAVEGQKFRSDKVTFSHTGESGAGFAERYVSKYPVGAQVTVYYEPDDPDFSALEPNVKESYRYSPCLISILTVAAVASACGLYSMYYRRRLAPYSYGAIEQVAGRDGE